MHGGKRAFPRAEHERPPLLEGHIRRAQQQISLNTVPVVIPDLPCPNTMYVFYRRFSANPLLQGFLGGLRSFEPRAKR